MKKAIINYLCIDNAIDRQTSDHCMAYGIAHSQFDMRERGMAEEINKHVLNAKEPTLIVITMRFLHAPLVSQLLQNNFMKNQHVKVMTGVFGEGYCDEKGDTIRPREE